ncbi:efflux RND transporter permease subunit [Halostella litorea]|uniref:efflux RND transporter permease subunit n=1 Tax=Halostella litorea TaxID=2528831 RepID=UPI00109316D1|nr:MMPL family transporter [Halostella litorea]
MPVHTMLRSKLRQAVDAVTEHNRATLLVMVLLTGLVVAGIPQLDTTSQAGGSAEDFQHLESVEKAQYIDANYGNGSAERSNRTVRSVYVRTEDGNALSKSSLLAGLRYQQEITGNADVRAALHGDGVRGIENLVAARAAGDANATLDEQVAALENASAAQVETHVEQVVAGNPAAARFLPAGHGDAASSTDRRILVVLDANADEETLSDADTALYETAEARSDDGIFVLNADAYAEANDHFFGEMVELVLPVALLVVLTVLAFGYRDLVDVAVGMTGVALSVLWMFGLLGWLGVSAGTISIVPVVLISGLSIDFGFHVFNRYREQRGPEEGIREPMGRGVRLVSTALILVTVTASIGFLANLVNPLPVIRDLGISITLGVVSALLIFVTVVPALKISVDGLLERFGLDRRKTPLGHGTYLRPALGSCVTLAKRAAPAVLVLSVLIAAAGGLAWTGLEEESFQQSTGEVAEWKQQLPDPLGWEPSDVAEQQQHVEQVYQPASSDDAIQSRILVEGNVTDPDTLEDIDAGVGRIDETGLLVTESGVRGERSPTTEMRRVAAENETFAAVLERADTDGNGVPDRNLSAVYDAFYAADADAAERVVERRGGEYRSVLVRLSLDASYADASSAAPKLEDGAAAMAEDGVRTATPAGSLAINAAVLGEIVGGIVLTMAVALLAIAVALTAAFRYMHGSATLGTVVAVPIVLVVGLVIGGMYLLSIPLTILTALLMSLVIGLGVDYNIHVGDRFADELAAGRSSTEALRAAVTGTGGALLGSTLTSAGALAAIALVPNPLLESFGGIVVIALVTSFLVSLLVLPSLLVLWTRYGVGTVAVDAEVEETASSD